MTFMADKLFLRTLFDLALAPPMLLYSSFKNVLGTVLRYHTIRGTWSNVIGDILRYTRLTLVRWFVRYFSVIEYVHFADGTGRILYQLDGDEYSINFKAKGGPRKFVEVTRGSLDVTDYVVKALGPGKNFYGIPTTPKLLGFSDLTFIDILGEETHYGSDDIITV